MLPWAGPGVVIGAYAMGRMDEKATSFTMGLIVVGLAVLHLYRRARPPIAGGQTLLVCAPFRGHGRVYDHHLQSAGPLMVIYLLAMRLPKMEYMGTGAAFFLMLNFFKLPFMVGLGLINRESLYLDLVLAPAVIVGTLLGRWLLGRINQRLFENIAIVLTIAAGLKMFL